MASLIPYEKDNDVQPFFKNGWVIAEGGMPGIKAPSNETDDAGSNFGEVRLDSKYIQSISLSMATFEALAVPTGATTLFYPSIQDITGITMTVYENYKLEAFKYFYTWLSMIRNSDGTYNLPKDFKQNIKIKLNDVNGRTVLYVTCKGCWPKGGHTYDFDHTATLLTPSISFAMDGISVSNSGFAQG